MFLYKVQTLHKQLAAERQSRLTYAQAILNHHQVEDDFSSKIIMSDEAHFNLSGYVDKQYLRFWGAENQRITHDVL
ncbi:hypothetical protein CVS40_10893 [Lucilia cuprina]|nr:hypothetical protein CVS40_10893 [Lucilia cuprina]